MSFYDDAKYGHVTRKWFGLPTKWGGEGGAGPASSTVIFNFGTHDPGTRTYVEKWFPQGPITIKKIGVFVCSTSNNASGGLMNFRFLTRGASASVIGTLQFASCTNNEGTIPASKTSLTVDHCKAGEYITVTSFEPTTKTNGTEVKSTTSGGAAFFIDYAPKYVSGGSDWDL